MAALLIFALDMCLCDLDRVTLRPLLGRCLGVLPTRSHPDRPTHPGPGRPASGTPTDRPASSTPGDTCTQTELNFALPMISAESPVHRRYLGQLGLPRAHRARPGSAINSAIACIRTQMDDHYT